MSSKTQFIEIELQNYRQYYGKQVISFKDRKSGFDVILGNNGSGKSNILNALNWCFFKTEPYMDENIGKIIVNENSFNDDVKEEQQGTMAVKIKLKMGDDEYHVSRILTYVKHPSQYEQTEKGPVLRIGIEKGYILPVGTEVIDVESTFKILEKPKKFRQFTPIESSNPNTTINRILPPELSQYFFLDGEYLENFWRYISTVKVGVESISQLNFLTKTVDHLNRLESLVPKIGDLDFDKLTNEIKTLERYENSLDADGNIISSQKERYLGNDSSDIIYYSATGYPRIRELEEDKNKIKNDLSAITEEFRTSNVDTIKNLESEIIIMNKDLEKTLLEFNTSKNAYVKSQIHNGPLYFLSGALKSVSEIIDNLRIKGDLPYDTKRIFTQDILTRGNCICGNDLKSKLDKDGDETNTARIKVSQIRDSMEQDKGLDYALNMQTSFQEQILRNAPEFMKNSFDVIETTYVKAKQKYRRISEELQAKRRQRQTFAKDDDELKKLIKNHDYLIELNSEIVREIEQINYKIGTNRDSIGEKKKERTHLENKTQKAKKIAHEQSVLDIISKIINQTLRDLQEKIRIEVETKTFKNFKNIMYKEQSGISQLKSFTIKPDYSVQLVDNRDSPALSTLSKGEKLFLALSFISALKESTGYTFPLVIDTPLARVSGISRVLLSKALPYFLPDEQIIFLATSSEFCDPVTNFDNNEKFSKDDEIAFGELLERNVSIDYKKIDPKTEGTRIIDFIPSWRKK